MQTLTIEQTGVGISPEIDMNRSRGFYWCSLAVSVSGTATYSIEHSLDGSNWLPHSTMSNKTAASDGNYSYPVLAVRVNVTAGSGTATLTLLQAQIG